MKAGAVDIYCFSGTGNTILVARAMQEAFEADGVQAQSTGWRRRTRAQ